MEENGRLKIPSEQDRITIAALLIKHGYRVRIARKKRNGSAYDQYVVYDMVGKDLQEEE